jgi:CheY-like chemotaxis protein
LDGYMLLEAIRSQESKQNLSKLNTIVISGKSVKAGMTKGLNDQCDDYLTKPVDSEMILRSLQNLALL